MKASANVPVRTASSWYKKNKSKVTLSLRAIGFVAALGFAVHLGLSRNYTPGFKAFEEEQAVAKQMMYVHGVPNKEYVSCIKLPILKTEKTASVMIKHTQEEVELVAKVIAGNPDVFESDTEMAAIAWVILNRVDSSDYPDTIKEVVEKGDFEGYDDRNPIYQHIEDIAKDVLIRWNDSKAGFASERILPAEYIDYSVTRSGIHFEDSSGKEWDWSLDSPYET